jgi:hypothetical protein
VPTVLKSGSLILLEHLGLVQACNGIALPLSLPVGQGLEKSKSIKENSCGPQGYIPGWGWWGWHFNQNFIIK